jgi:outer membrane cobalamin receptor
MSTNNTAASLAFMAALLPGGANAQTPTPPPQDRPTFQDTVQVTATRFGEAVAEVPGSINVITGDEIRARGATDLRTALALLGGVSVAPGGARSGRRGPRPVGCPRSDDLLLLIDGILLAARSCHS